MDGGQSTQGIEYDHPLIEKLISCRACGIALENNLNLDNNINTEPATLCDHCDLDGYKPDGSKLYPNV